MSELTLLLVFACIAGFLVTSAFVYCLKVPFHFALFSGLIAVVCTALFNWILVSTMLLRSGSVARLVATAPALIVGMVIGVTLAASFGLYLEPDEIKAELVESRRTALQHRFSSIPHLEDQVAHLRKTAASPPRRLVDEDPGVAPLLRKREQVQTLLNDAEAAYVGELDGSSGTGRSGPGPVATAQRERRDRLQEEIGRIDTLLDAARTTARTSIENEAKSASDEATEMLNGTAARDGSPGAEGLLVKLAREKADLAAAEKVPLDEGSSARLGALAGLLLTRPGTVLPTMLAILFAYTTLHLAPVLFTRDADDEADERKDHQAEKTEQKERERLNATNGVAQPSPRREG